MFHVFKYENGTICVVNIKKTERYKNLIKFHKKRSKFSLIVDSLDMERVQSVDIVDGELVYNNKIDNQDELKKAKRAERNATINSVQWRIERHSRETALGIKNTEDIKPVLEYIQKLADWTDNDGEWWSQDLPEAPA